MAQFSIREALRFSFSTYGRHLVLLICAAAVVAGTHQLFRHAPRFVAEKLGIHREIDVNMTMIPQDGQTDQSVMVLQKVQEVTAKISTHIQTTPKHLLGLVFLTWLIFWILYAGSVLGFMKLCLALKDKGTSSLGVLISVSSRQVIRFVGAFILYILYIMCGIIGVSVLTIPFAMLCKGFCGDAATGVLSVILWFILFAAMIAWIVGYAFFGFCIVDNPAVGARQALRMSRELSRGLRWHIIGAFVVASVISTIALLVVHKLSVLGSSEPLFVMTGARKDIAQVASIIVTTPFWMLYLAFIYRSLRVSNR